MMPALAAGVGTLSVDVIQKNVAHTVGGVSQVLMDFSVISGVAFVFAAFFKFHQHKLNPTQVPLSNGVVLLLVGAALCVFPSLIGTGSKAVFGTDISKAGSTDVTKVVLVDKPKGAGEGVESGGGF